MRRLQAHQLATRREGQELERFLVVKEAAGITAIGVAVLAAFIAWVLRWRESMTVVSVAAGASPMLLVFLLLISIHRRMVTVESKFTDTVLEAGSLKDDVSGPESHDEHV